MDQFLIGVKYCGGCREQYERKAEFEKVKAAIPDDRAIFVSAKEGEVYDSLVVICGCPVCCADISKYNVSGDTIKIDSKEGMNNLKAGILKQT